MHFWGILDEMNSKKPIKTLMYIYSAIAVAVLVLLMVLVFTGKLYKRRASIIIPDAGKYAETWSEQLPHIAQKLDIPEITIYTYKSVSELQSYLSQSEKYNVLWAEIPVCGEYNLAELFKTVDVCTIDKKYTQLFPWTLHNEIYKISAQKEVKFIPLSYNPYIMVRKAGEKSQTPFQYSLGAYSSEDAFAFLAYIRSRISPARASTNKSKGAVSQEEGIELIRQMVSDKKLIRNAHTYTNRDAFIALENNTVSECYMATSFFNSLSISQRQELTFSNMETTLIADATVAVFPIRKSEENKTRIQKAMQILVSPDVIYATANARNWMPASINSVSRSSYTEAIRKQARITSECYIPAMQYSNTTEAEELLNKLNEAMQGVSR